MFSDQINNLIDNPALLYDFPVGTLENWVKEYPYFETVHALLLKKYQLSDQKKYINYLPVAATCASNRKQLMYFINELELEKPEDEIVEVDMPKPDTEQESEKLEHEPEKETKQEPDNLTQTNEIETGQVESPENEPEEKHSFEDWLHVLEGKHINEVSETVADSSVPDEIGEMPELLDESFIAELKYQAELIGEITHQSLDESIEFFMEKQDGGESLKFKGIEDNEIQRVEEAARQSVEEKDETITETLADIMLGQGKINKAIEMFEKLGLKFPEKSVYFASRIEELKKN
jgi:hypothetical protein